MFNTIYIQSDMMDTLWFHHGSRDNRRIKGNHPSGAIRRSSVVLDMVDKIFKEVMERENDMGDSFVAGCKLVKDTIEFFLFLVILILCIGMGFVVSAIVTMVIFIMYLTDTSKNFWKIIKKT